MKTLTETAAPSLLALRVAMFVRSHGFTATVHDDAVTFAIPYTGPNGEKGEFYETVRTIAQARIALGY